DTFATDGVNPRPSAPDSDSPAGFGSSTVTLIDTGWLTDPVKLADTPVGGPVTFEAPDANDSTGGWLPIPSSLNGLIGEPLFNVNGIDCVSPLATIVHVIALVPKSFGTLMTNTPHWRPISK